MRAKSVNDTCLHLEILKLAQTAEGPDFHTGPFSTCGNHFLSQAVRLRKRFHFPLLASSLACFPLESVIGTLNIRHYSENPELLNLDSEIFVTIPNITLFGYL